MIPTQDELDVMTFAIFPGSAVYVDLIPSDRVCVMALTLDAKRNALLDAIQNEMVMRSREHEAAGTLTGSRSNRRSITVPNAAALRSQLTSMEEDDNV